MRSTLVLLHGFTQTRQGWRRTIAALDGRGPWPLLTVPLGTTDEDGAPRIVLCEPDGPYALSGRGWQRLAVPPRIRAISPRGAIALLTPQIDGRTATDGR
jgi:hypothetical protein